MRLKRLELQGFKSFLDRTILTFDQQVTGVVGPNGCGKSNIVDAIQWVMGEQSAKHLRGDSMTDVIFNGSDTKQAMSMAEVTLVLDRNGVALAPQFAAFDKAEEISITRRVYRDGMGEYFINKTPCRLRDIHELFMDTGVGKRAYSIIEQGQIDRMINVKPEDRRLLFEEVAGITKYKAKKKEAEKKLEATRANMVRLNDIVQELEKQIRSLKIQATRARKYREIKSELEAVDLYLLGRNLHAHSQKILELELRRDELIRGRAESDAAFGEVDASVTELEVKRIDQEKAYQESSDKERNLSLHIQKMESQIGLFEERKKHLLANIEANRSEAQEISREIEYLNQEIENETAQREQIESNLQEVDSAVRDLEETSQRFQNERIKTLHKKDQILDRRTEVSHRRVSVEQQKANFEQRETELNANRETLNQRLMDAVIALDTLKDRLVQSEEKIQQAQQQATKAEFEVTSMAQECLDSSRKLSEKEETLYKARENFHLQRSRLESLKELQENMEGYSPSAREMVKRLEGGSVAAVPLAEIMQPDADIEDHLENLLDLDMNTLLVQTALEAEELSRMVTAQELERVRVVALSDLEEGHVVPIPDETCQPLLSKLRIKPGYERAAHWWFGQTFLCESLESMFQLRQNNPHFTYIARDSRAICHSDRSITAGKPPTKTGVFARRREIEDLDVRCQAIEKELNELSTERENLLQNLQQQEKLHSEMKDNLSSIHIQSVEHRKEREKVHLELSRADRDYSGLLSESDANIKRLGEIRTKIIDLTTEHETLATEESRFVDEMAQLESEIAQVVAELDAVVTQVHAKKVERTSFVERGHALTAKIDRLSDEVSTQSDRLNSLQQQLVQGEQDLESVDREQVDTQQRLISSSEEKNALVVLISDLKNAFNETCQTLNELRERRSELQKKREAVLVEAQELEIHLAHEKSSFDHVQAISQERYQRDAQPLDESTNMDLALLPLFTEQLSIEWVPLPDREKRMLLEEHLKNLREKVSRYGEVNLTAIQEFDEVQQRYDFLMNQRTDLEKSIAILEDAIKKIDETTKVRFAETFEAVNKKFTEIFPILFNGGKAELTLIQQEGSLETGVDIMASPPGKRLQSITLLSGGEKALTAVSLVLAIFARKPSPFCLLDEVDAPLDDANVSRFNTVIRKMAEKTQFILITHNKKTMEIADALFGVTMERAGISRMASVRLEGHA